MLLIKNKVCIQIVVLAKNTLGFRLVHILQLDFYEILNH